MNPLFVYHNGAGVYVVRDLDEALKEDVKFLTATIDPARWLEFYLNADANNRRRMFRELKGGK